MCGNISPSICDLGKSRKTHQSSYTVITLSFCLCPLITGKALEWLLTRILLQKIWSTENIQWLLDSKSQEQESMGMHALCYIYFPTNFCHSNSPRILSTVNHKTYPDLKQQYVELKCNLQLLQNSSLNTSSGKHTAQCAKIVSDNNHNRIVTNPYLKTK